MGRRSVRGIEVPKAYTYSHESAENWTAGYEHGLRQCDHHPEAMTTAAVDAIVSTERLKLRSATDTAYNTGYREGKSDEMNDRQLTRTALTREFERGKNYGFNEAHEAGKLEGQKEAQGRSDTWLMEAFILFMQEHGSEMAAMTLGQMHELRHTVNQVDEMLSSIEEPR